MNRPGWYKEFREAAGRADARLSKWFELRSDGKPPGRRTDDTTGDASQQTSAGESFVTPLARAETKPRWTELTALALGHTGNVGPPAESLGRDVQTRYITELKLSDPYVTWREETDESECERDRVRAVRIELTWQPHEGRGVLIIHLGAPLLLGQSHCEVRVLDASGHEIARGAPARTDLRVDLSTDDYARARTLDVTYDRPGRYKLQFAIALP